MVRWLGRVDVKVCYNEGTIRVSSVVFAVLEEVNFSLFGRVVYGTWVADTMPRSTETRPDTFCGHYSGWGHIKAKCSTTHRCAWCGEVHRAASHRYLLEGRVAEGQT